MGTRYERGDFVIPTDEFQNTIYMVQDVEDPDSNSPTYSITKELGDGAAGLFKKASNLRKLRTKGYHVETIQSKIQQEVEESAQRFAAKTWSVQYPGREGVAMGVARFGEFTAVDGEIVDSIPDTDGMKELDAGGSVPSSEEEIDLGQVIYTVTRFLDDMEGEVVEKVAEVTYGEGTGFVYEVVSGTTWYYAEEE